MEERVEQAIVGLADETLGPEERARALQLVAETPGADDALALQRSAKRMLAATAVSAPLALRARVEALHAPPARTSRRPRLSLPAFPRLAAAGLALAALLAALLVVPGLVTDRDGAVRQVALASVRAAQEPAPPPADDPRLLDISFAGVTYPRWGGEFGWREVGARTDTIVGRRARTVFYLHEGHRLGYTVLAGAPIPLPEGGRQVSSPIGPIQVYEPEGLDYPSELLAHGGRPRVAIFERNGRTCVLAGVAHRERTLVELASWRGDGVVRF